MKPFHKLFSAIAIACLAFAPLANGGEVVKKPLKMEQAVKLYEKQERDFKDVKHTEGGRRKGFGLLVVAAAAAAGYYIAENVDGDDVDDAKERLGIKK